jgi:hypothetical protein
MKQLWHCNVKFHAGIKRVPAQAGALPQPVVTGYIILPELLVTQLHLYAWQGKRLKFMCK